MDKILDFLNGRLEIIKEYNLEAEVMYFALKAMKENPNLTIEEAFNLGCEQWDI